MTVAAKNAGRARQNPGSVGAQVVHTDVLTVGLSGNRCWWSVAAQCRAGRETMPTPDRHLRQTRGVQKDARPDHARIVATRWAGFNRVGGFGGRDAHRVTFLIRCAATPLITGQSGAVPLSSVAIIRQVHLTSLRVPPRLCSVGSSPTIRVYEYAFTHTEA